jgi:hypothetical protein
VLVECDESLTMDVDDLERKIGPRTKAIMPVHMVGRPCRMDRILAIARKHELKIIEDACQAVGGSYQGRRLTTLGHAGAFSFNQFKNIACGEGGGLATNDTLVYHRALIYHDLGANFRVHVKELQVPVFLGGNYRFNEVLAAIMNVQLSRLDGILERLRARKNRFLACLKPHELFRPTPTHDAAGDCGTNLALIFATVEARTQFVERMKEIDPEVSVSSPIDSGIHVYANWKPLLEQRASYHPLTCAYHHPANRECRKITKGSNRVPADFHQCGPRLVRETGGNSAHSSRPGDGVCGVKDSPWNALRNSSSASLRPISLHRLALSCPGTETGSRLRSATLSARKPWSAGPPLRSGRSSRPRRLVSRRVS